MNSYTRARCHGLLYRVLSAFIAFTFTTGAVMPPRMAAAQVIPTVLNLPVPGTMVPPSPAFVPVLLKGMTIHPDNPLQFDFIIDSGNTDFDEARIKAESERLVKYFLASMTIPKDDLWVNLSPYESEKIIPEALGKTELGRDMLAQDYILKQLTASLMYPEKELGKEFWAKVYKQAQEKYGTTEIPVDTFNKVWILPETATVYEHEKTVYIVEARLKVMLEHDYNALQQSRAETPASLFPEGKQQGLDADYLTMQQETKDQRLKTKDLRSDEEKSSVIGLQSSVPTAIIKEIILPAIEKEVNEGQNFAPLRQIYHSLILAKWYKETIKNSLLSKVYVDKKLLNGIRLEDGQLKGEDGSIIDSQSSIVDQIYDQYMEAYKKGVFNYIKEDYVAMDSQQESTATSRAPTRGDRLSGDVIPRKYFSGGERFTNFEVIKLDKTSNPARVASARVGQHFSLTTITNPQKDGVLIPRKSSSPVLGAETILVAVGIGLAAWGLSRVGKRAKGKALSKISERTDLFGAYYDYDGQMVQSLLYSGADVNAINMEGMTLLQTMLRDAADINGTRLFLEHQNLSDAQRWKRTKWLKEMIKLILSEKADVDKQVVRPITNEKGLSSLHFAAVWGDSEIFRILLNESRNVDAKDKDGTTPLIIAAYRGHTDIVDMLIRKGADVNAKDDLGTALQRAQDQKHQEIVSLLLKAGAQNNQLGSQSSSPMFSRDELEVLYGRELVLGFPFEREYALVYGRDIFVAPLGSRDPKTAQYLNVLLGSQLVDGQYVLVGSFSKGPIAIMKLGFFANPQEAEGNSAIIIQNQMSLNAGKFITSLSEDRIMMSEVWTTAIWMTEEQWHQVMNDFANMAGRLTEFKPVTPRIKIDYIDVSKNGMDGQIKIKIGRNLSSSPVTKDEKLDQSSPSDTPQSSSPVNPAFMDEMRQQAAKLGISLGENTKIAVFIGSEQITASDHYYQMFKDVVRRNFKFDLVYLPFVIEEGAANSEERIQLIKEQLAHNPRVIGATITRPWKERFFEPGDNGIGAVNYILKDRNGRLQRMATDGPTWVDGLNEDLKAQKILKGPDASYDFQNKKIVILGSGGSARELADTLNGKLKGAEAKITFTDTDESKRISLKETLNRLNPTYTTVFLAPDDLSNLRRAIRDADILINATGVGRGETEGQSPLLPYLFAEARHDLIVSDLISNTDTQMLKDARETGPEGIKTFYGRSMYIRGMAHFIKGWMEQVNKGEQRIPSEDELYRAINQSEFTSKEIFQAAWSRFGYREHYYSNMGELIRKIANLKEGGKISKAAEQYEDALKAAIAFTETRIVPDVYVVDSGEESFGAEWMDKSFGRLTFEQGIYIERSLLDTIQQKGDPADMLTRVFVHVLTTGSIVKKRKAQFEYAKAKFPRLIHHLLDPVNGGTKNIEEVLWDVRDNVLGLMTADHVRDSLGDIGVNYTVTLDKKKQQEIRRHGEELADIAESALHKIAINALNKTIDLDIYQRMHLKEHEMTDEDNFSIGTLAFAANPPTFAHALVAALKAMAESNSDIFYVSATFSDFRKSWLRTTYEKRQDINSDFFGMLSGGLIKVMPRLPHDDGFNGEEKVLPILDILDGAGNVNLWYGAGDDHYFAFAFKDGKVKFEKIIKEGPARNYNDFAYYVNMPGYKSLLERLLRDHKSLIPAEHLPMIEEIVQAQNPADALEEKEKGKAKFFPVLDTIGKLWLIQDEVNHRKETGQYTTNFTLGMINTLRLGVQEDGLRDSLDFPVQYNSGASFEIASTKLRNGVIKLIKDRKIDLVFFEAMSKGLLKQLLSPTSGDRQYLYSLVRSDKGLIAAKAVEALFPLNDKKEDTRHQKLMDQLKADLSAVVPEAVVDERLEGDISQITVSDAGRMKDLIQYTYSVHNGLFPDGRGREIVLVGNIRVGEDVSAQLKDDLLKAITRYVRAYNYAEGFVGIQDVLIKDLVRRDRPEGELRAGDADVIMVPGNDDLNVYREALDLLSRGVGKYLLISGGLGRLRHDIKRAADKNGFSVEMASEAQMIRSIMIQMAEQNPGWHGLVDGLRGDDIVILEEEAAYTVANFQKAREQLKGRGLLGEGKKVKVLYIQKPLQQLRTKGAFNSVFVQELWAEKIAGVSYTTDYTKEVNTPSDIVAEYFRIIANHQKKTTVGVQKIGDWEMEKGLNSIAGNHWAYALLLFKDLTPEEKQKLADEMRTNIRNMGIDDRTVLYKGLPKEAKDLAKEIYEYRSSSPASSSESEERVPTADRLVGMGENQDKLGGIDMNDIDVNRKGTGVDIQFDPAELQELIDAGIDGFAPVIINITPLPSVLPLLGLEPAIKEENQQELVNAG